MLPPTYLTCLEIAAVRPPARGAGRGRGPGGRHVHPAGRRGGRRRDADDAGRPAAAGGGADPGTPAHDLDRGSFGEHGECVLAPNANFMTLDGTNTWILREREVRPVGRHRPGTARRGSSACRGRHRGRRTTVLLTHHHLDHAEGARAFAERVGCGVRALDPALRLGSEGLADGEVGRGRRPGDPRDRHPRPHRRLAVVPGARGGCRAHRRHRAGPGHHRGGPSRRPARRLPRLAGPAARARRGPRGRARSGPATARSSTTPSATLDYYIAHRRERLAQVEAAVARLRDEPHPEGLAVDELPRRVVEIVYADVDPVLWGAAELSVRAQLAYLADRG